MYRVEVEVISRYCTHDNDLLLVQERSLDSHLTVSSAPFFIFGRSSANGPVVTCSLKGKWYTLYLIHPDGTVTPQPYDWGYDDRSLAYERVEVPNLIATRHGWTTDSPFLDHVPNPGPLLRWALDHDYDIHPLAWEMIIGRWMEEGSGGFSEKWEEYRDALCAKWDRPIKPA